jgi:beta-glucosidase
VFEGHTGDVADDHYHRYKEDVALMKRLGVGAYRFSVSWSRVLPAGAGAVNEKGFDFYKRLLDELDKNKITPAVTLFHWDYPQALYDKGGWLNRDSAAWFGDYATLVVQRLGDRVKTWITQNEPQCYIGLGMLDGTHAPGVKLPFPKFLEAAHNSMRAHAKAVQAIRAATKTAADTKIGYTLAMQVTHPADPANADDVEAARRAFSRNDGRTTWSNSFWMDPVLLGKYPEDGQKLFGADMPKGFAADLAEMKQPIDFVGLNIYTSSPWTHKDGKPVMLPTPPGYPRSAVDWQPIVPQALYWGPKFAYERYQLPIFITENGLSTRDQVFLDGKVHDPQRVDYLHRVLPELARAIGDGVPVRGYYHWSMMDNFEWADGYKQRFGLVYVDYQTQKRIPKDSFDAYRAIIASNGKNVLGRKTAQPVTVVTAS